jgi:ubiquinone/menaquinone biosynthesis C-methylase UbiE
VASPDKVRKMLDVGTGPGILLTALKRVCEQSMVVGLDVSTTFTKIARNELRSVDGDLILADAQNMPLRDDSFDLVVSSNSLHHWKQPPTVFKEIERVTKPEAGAVISDFRRDLDANQLNDLQASYSWSLRGMLRDSVRKSFLKDEVSRFIGDLAFERREVTNHARGLRIVLANKRIR